MTCLSSRVPRGLSWDVRIKGPQRPLQTSPQGGLWPLGPEVLRERGEHPAVGVCTVLGRCGEPPEHFQP